MCTFEEYARTNVTGLLRLAAVLSGDRHLAEDVVQEVLFRACRHWDRIRDCAVPDAYVRRMVVNEYLAWRRKWARYSPRPEIDITDVVPDPAEALAVRDELAARLRALPARQRTVLVLRYYADMADGQIADVLHCTRGTVRSIAARALAALRIDSAEPDRTTWKDHRNAHTG
jgi:RNA polymerase sigma-70 factor (sigma-E family)